MGPPIYVATTMESQNGACVIAYPGFLEYAKDIIGDQLFTDMLGGNLLGAYTVLTEPYEPESMTFFKFKRACERIIMKFWRD